MKTVRWVFLILFGLLTVFFSCTTLLCMGVSAIAVNDHMPNAREYVDLVILYGSVTLCLFGILIWLVRRRLKPDESKSSKETTVGVGENP